MKDFTDDEILRILAGTESEETDIKMEDEFNEWLNSAYTEEDRVNDIIGLYTHWKPTGCIPIETVRHMLLCAANPEFLPLKNLSNKTNEPTVPSGKAVGSEDINACYSCKKPLSSRFHDMKYPYIIEGHKVCEDCWYNTLGDVFELPVMTLRKKFKSRCVICQKFEHQGGRGMTKREARHVSRHRQNPYGMSSDA